MTQIESLMKLVDEHANARHGRGFVSDDSVTYPALRKRERDLRVSIEHAANLLLEAQQEACSDLTDKAWRPIATAPKDGTAILAYIPDPYGGDEIDIVAWVSDGASGVAWCRARCVDGLEAGVPTHWMPLPTVPTA